MADRVVVGDTPIPIPAGAARRWGVDPKAARPLGDGLVAVAVPQIWVEVPFEAWTAAYRLAVQGGALVIAELRLFPGGAARAADEPIGLWAGEALGAGAQERSRPASERPHQRRASDHDPADPDHGEDDGVDQRREADHGRDGGAQRSQRQEGREESQGQDLGDDQDSGDDQPEPEESHRGPF